MKLHSISGSGSPPAVQLILKSIPVTEVIESGVGCCVKVGGTKEEQVDKITIKYFLYNV